MTRFQTLACPLALLIASCSNITPTKTVDLCQGDTLSRNCAACTGPLLDPHCEQCKGTSPAKGCKNGDAGPTATGGATGGSGSGGKGGASGASGTGGGGTGSGGAGTGGNGSGGKDAGKDAGPCAGACTGNKPVCVSGACEECGDDSDCTDPTKTRCEPSTHACVQCLGKADCSGTTPQCDTSAHACVECLTPTDCKDAAKPVCAENACVACAINADCKDPTQPECKDHACGACTGNTACADRAATPHCDTVTSSASKGQCVQCLAHADCENPTPQCNTSRQCVACTSNAACTGRTNATICDLSSNATYGGTCVQCTVSAETPCGANVCVPSTRACAAGHPKNSKDTCEKCLADSECVTSHRCIPMQFNGLPTANANCLKQLSATCAKPYLSTPIHRASVSGALADDYCGISEATTSCEAILGLIGGATCPGGNDSTCIGEGAICRTVNGGPDLCTYACGLAIECPTGANCSSGYCGGP